MKNYFKFCNCDCPTGFTLAEVLITLGIIGVVAAITMPALVANYQKHVTVNRLKETYAKITQVINLAQSDVGQDPEGSILNNLLEGADGSTIEDSTEFFVDNYIVPYMKTSKISKFKSPSSLGFPLYKDLAGKLDSDAYTFYGSNRYVIVELANGVIMYIHNGATGVYAENSSQMSIIIFVDINGLKNPNVTGKDLFAMSYYAKSRKLAMLYSNSSNNKSYYLEHCKKGEGTIRNRACGALIQYDGWKISPDYPW